MRAAIKNQNTIGSKPSQVCHISVIKIKTYPADCRKIAAVDSNKHDWD